MLVQKQAMLVGEVFGKLAVLLHEKVFRMGSGSGVFPGSPPLAVIWGYFHCNMGIFPKVACSSQFTGLSLMFLSKVVMRVYIRKQGKKRYSV